MRKRGLFSCTERNTGRERYRGNSVKKGRMEAPIIPSSVYMSLPRPKNPAKSYRLYAEDQLSRPSHPPHSLHKRSRSELIGHSYSKPTPQRDLRLVTEESSSGVSESELIIRRIIAETSTTRKPTPSENPDLTAGLQLVQQEIETERRKTAGRKRTVRQQVLHLVSVCGRAGSEEWSMSPEPRAQAVPVFRPIKRENRAALRAAMDFVRTPRERVDLTLALNAYADIDFFLVQFETREVTNVSGVYGWRDGAWRRVWGGGEEGLDEKRVDTCYRFGLGGFRVLPHNRVSRAVDAVVLV